MAEAVLAIGLASSIIQLIDYGSRVIKRLKYFSSSVESLPAAFRNVQITLPLILDILRRTRQQIDFGEVNHETQAALQPLLEGCTLEVRRLEDILAGLLPQTSDSPFKKTSKAVSSVLREKKIEGIASALQKFLQVLTCHQASSSAVTAGQPTKALFMVPFPKDLNFVGRTDVLKAMQERFRDEGNVALAGIGGVGKSQIAIHYCYLYQVQYPQRHVFWIHAGSTTRIDEGYRNIARGLSLPGWREPATDIHQIVDDWLLSVDNGPWLLVVDSADDMSVFFATESGIPGTKLQPITILLRRVAQSSHGSLIITTRDKRLGRRLLNGSHPVEVPLMNDEDAKQLLRARGAGSSPTEVDTQALVRMLGFLPLAITQAAAFISENQTSVATYNEIFRCTNWRRAAVLGEDLTDPRRDPESMNSVLDTWKISFEQLAHQSPRAASFLSTMAVLSPGAVPSALLRRDGESLLEFTKAMGILKAFSLIDADDRETNYRMHDLVHLATQEWLESRGQRATYEEGALQVVADKFPSGESQQWDQCKKIYPHAGVVEHFDTLSASTSLQKARLKQKMANYLRAQDQYDQAMKRHEEAAEAFETERGTRDLETLNNMSDMGLTLTYQGNSTKGERLLRTAASGIEEIQGPQDLDTMNHLARLAENLLCQAKFSTAERIYRRVYTNRKAILGEGHLDTLLSLSYLGPPLEWLGRLEESEDVNKRAVGGMQRILPVHHAGLYLAEVKLGFILQKRGKLEEAESSARRSLENRLAIYGPGHKWVSWSTQTLSLTLRDQGRHEEALYHSKAVVQMREREFPANHILVIKAIYTLAFLYHGLQDYDQASIHYLDCLARAQMSYGLLHPLPVAIRAQYLRMIERTTDVELNWRTCVSPRAFWMTLSPKQFSILAHFAGVPDPQRHNRNMGVELFETYCFVLVTYARRLWHRVMHKVIVGLITLLVILCESMIFSWIDRRIPFSSYSG